MKALLILILFAIFIITQSNARAQVLNQEPEKAAPETDVASAEAVKLFQQQKFDEALPVAEKAVKLSSRQYGARHLKTAQAFINLANIQFKRDKKGDAVKAFEAAVNILGENRNLSQAESLNLARVHESLATLKFSAGKEGGAEKHLQAALEIREKFDGLEAKETVNALLSLGNLNASVGEHEQAGKYFRRAYDIRMKKPGDKLFENFEIYMRCKCSLLKAGQNEEAKALSDQFTSLLKPYEGKGNPASDSKRVESRVLKLRQPVYPNIPGIPKVAQEVKVRVLIDETGKVVYACAADNRSAHPAIINASETAAYNSTFSPASYAGKPVKSVGSIVYRFIK